MANDYISIVDYYSTYVKVKLTLREGSDLSNYYCVLTEDYNQTMFPGGYLYEYTPIAYAKCTSSGTVTIDIPCDPGDYLGYYYIFMLTSAPTVGSSTASATSTLGGEVDLSDYENEYKPGTTKKGYIYYYQGTSTKYTGPQYEFIAYDTGTPTWVTAPTKINYTAPTGYTFFGWTPVSDTYDTDIVYGNTVTALKKALRANYTTLYGLFEKSIYITYYPQNDTTSKEVVLTHCLYGAGASMYVYPNEPSLSKEHYTFLGWSLEENGDIVDWQTALRTSTGAIYAIWQPINYTITYDGNGISALSDSVTYNADNASTITYLYKTVTKNYDKIIKNVDGTETTSVETDSFSVSCWTAIIDGVEQVFYPGNSLWENILYKNITLYASYTYKPPTSGSGTAPPVVVIPPVIYPSLNEVPLAATYSTIDYDKDNNILDISTTLERYKRTKQIITKKRIMTYEWEDKTEPQAYYSKLERTPPWILNAPATGAPPGTFPRPANYSSINKYCGTVQINEFIQLVNKHCNTNISIMDKDMIMTYNLFNQIATAINNVDITDASICYIDKYIQKAEIPLLEEDVHITQQHFLNLSHSFSFLRLWEKEN